MSPRGAGVVWLPRRHRGIPRNEPVPEADSEPPARRNELLDSYRFIPYRVVAQEFVVQRARARRVGVSGPPIPMLQIVRAFPKFLSDGVAPIDHTARCLRNAKLPPYIGREDVDESRTNGARRTGGAVDWARGGLWRCGCICSSSWDSVLRWNGASVLGEVSFANRAAVALGISARSLECCAFA
jgi:hypothetical protein